MPLSMGEKLGPYEILSAIGAGGMGEVYKARDTRLSRMVAIKVLPEHLASNAEARQRFEREAQAVSSLNHPHICTLYDVGRQDGSDYLVMEYLEGETLAARLRKGPLPAPQALEYGVQITMALAEAHKQDVFHRDLKPGNIMLTKTGAKLLDFGLAKLARAEAAPGADQPTVSADLTAKGTLLGTLPYMAPEQLEGKEADARSDIFAFGAVIYEMLAGRRAFEGKSQASVMAAILEHDPPPISTLQPLTPPALDRVTKTCLAKDPDDRWQTARDLKRELGWIASAPESGSPAPASFTAASRYGSLPWIAAAVALIALAIPAARHLRETPPPETRVDIVTPATDSPTSFALSPDGRKIVFGAWGDGASRLWLRSLATTAAQPLAGTEGATVPFWSPDSRSIGFFAGNALKRLDLGGGAPQTLAPAVAGRGGTWNAEGVIVFAPSLSTPLMRVSATGGTAVAVTTLGPQQRGHHAPFFLPDGRRLLFYMPGAPDMAGIYLGALDGRAPTRLTPADGSGAYLGGWLLWVRAGTLVAQRLDGTKAALTGEPVTVAEGVPVDITLSRSAVSVAATGLVAYRTGGGSQRQLTWVDRSGTARGTVGAPDATLDAPRVSPDGHRVIVGRDVQGNVDLWLLDGARMSRFTFDPAWDTRPVWSPDGARIVFRSHRSGSGDLYQKLTSGAGVEEPLVASDQIKTAYSWSADGRFLLYSILDLKGDVDLWIVPMAGDRTPSVFLKTPFREGYGAFSPDARWVAYQSNESGRPEIYVRPFVPPGAAGTAAAATGSQWQVSTAGGITPAWRPDGKELYYLNPAGAMMAAPIAVSGATLEPGAPVVLFPTRIFGGGVDGQQGRQYDVAPDGRFLINMELGSAAAPITLIQNWNPAVKK